MSRGGMVMAHLATSAPPDPNFADVANRLREEAVERFGRFEDWEWHDVLYLIEELEAGVLTEAARKPSDIFEGAEPDLAAPGLSLARIFVTQGDYPYTVRKAFPQIAALATAALDNTFVRSNWEDFEDGAWDEYRPLIEALEAIERAAKEIAPAEPQPAE